MRALVIAFTLVSLSFLVLAVRSWRSEAASAPVRPERSRWRGGLILTGISLLALAGLWLGAGAFGWGRDRALWVGLGGFLALATVARPWWFWENYKARWLRGLIGDEGTAFVYLLVAGVMVWVGMFTDWRFGRR
jgi:hypothetical protein